MNPFIRRFLIALLSLSAATAAVSDTSETTLTRSKLLGLSDQEAAVVATEWGLTMQEWREYEQLMSGKRGLWSPGLDPIMALGVNARTSAERDRYAELYVKEEFARVERELAFQRAVSAAWTRLYPNTPRIANLKRAFSDAAIDRYGVVVSSDCGQPCRESVNKYLQALQDGEAVSGLDLYLADSGDDDALLRRWVREAGIPLDAIKQGRVTINHGGRFAAIGHYPLVYGRQGDGSWKELQ